MKALKMIWHYLITGISVTAAFNANMNAYYHKESLWLFLLAVIVSMCTVINISSVVRRFGK